MSNTQLQKIENDANEIIAAEVVEAVSLDEINELYFQLGGLDAIDAISTNLMSALIRTYQKIRDTQSYAAHGYKRFDDFLDNHPRSRMSYKRFNYLEGVYKNLGQEPFDLLSGSGLSMRQLKLLGKGNVEMSGDKLVIQQDGGQVAIEINNRRQWMECLRALADANAEKSIKLERQKEKIDKHDDKVREIYAELDTVKAAKIAETASNPHMVARVELGIAFRKLTEAAAALSAIEKEQFRDGVLEDVAAWRFNLTAAYATGKVTEPGPVQIKGDDFGTALDDFLENDGDLAAQL